MNEQSIRNILKSKKLKATKNRVSLLLEMKKYKTAIPYDKIQKILPLMDRVSLYRTIETLIEHGVIHKAYQEGSNTYYAFCDNSKCSKNLHYHDHLHFKCTNCNRVTCEKAKNSLEVFLPKTVIKNIKITVEGICSTCNQAITH